MNQISTALRFFSKKPIFSAITLTGFSIAIAASLLIYFWIQNELSFDKFHPGYTRIYRVLTLSKQGTAIVKSPACYRPVAQTMKNDYPQIEAATYISYSSEDSPLQTDEASEKIEARMCWTNNDFFKVFGGFKFTEGTPETAFSSPDNIILSEAMAKKLFGSSPAIGKTLISDKYFKDVYKVGGVIRIPDQSHIDFGFMLSEKNHRYSTYSYNWGDRGWVRVYIKLKKDAVVTEDLITQMSDHLSRYSRITDKLVFQPLADIHLRSDYPSDSFGRRQGNIKYVYIFSILALVIILMACLNYATLAVARASERSVEIGIRKANGCTRAGIFVNFMKESVLQILASAFLAALLILYFSPLFETIFAQPVSFHFSFGNIAILMFLILTTSFLAGLYPAMYLSSLNPTGIFRRGTLTGSKSNFIGLLVTIQFSLAAFFIIAIMLFVRQLNFIHNSDAGLHSGNVVVIQTGLWYDNRQFKEELLRNPRIVSVSASTWAPIETGFKQGLPMARQGFIDTLQVNYYFVDEDFAKTYGLEVKKGQFLQMTNADYWSLNEKASKAGKNEKENVMAIPVVINETAEKLFGFDDPIGQRLGNYLIVGVVKDFHFRTLHHPIEPLIMTNNPEAISSMNIRIAPGNTRETLDFIKLTYMKNRDNREFSYKFFDDIVNEEYEGEIRLKNITSGLGIVAVLIAILGILGLTVFSISWRTKEIGMRKVSGATTAELLIMLNGKFLIYVAAAYLIAAPVAWLILRKWLSNFAYKTALSWWIFALAGFIVFLIAIGTVTWQCWKAASRNPVESLRYE
jgi:putative ABC transport system permease protein